MDVGTPAPLSKPLVWTGRLIAIPPIALLLFSAYMKLVPPADFAEGMAHLGWSVEKATGLAILEFACVALYLVPRTAVLGAILITGYMGGAIATHVRVDDGVVFQPLVGILAWGSLWLREPRLRALLPYRARLGYGHTTKFTASVSPMLFGAG